MFLNLGFECLRSDASRMERFTKSESYFPSANAGPVARQGKAGSVERRTITARGHRGGIITLADASVSRLWGTVGTLR